MPNLIASLVICCYCCWVAGSSFLCYCFSLFPFAALLLTQFYTLNTHTRGHFSNFISHATVDFLFAPSLSRYSFFFFLWEHDRWWFWCCCCWGALLIWGVAASASIAICDVLWWFVCCWLVVWKTLFLTHTTHTHGSSQHTHSQTHTHAHTHARASRQWTQQHVVVVFVTDSRFLRTFCWLIEALLIRALFIYICAIFFLDFRRFYSVGEPRAPRQTFLTKKTGENGECECWGWKRQSFRRYYRGIFVTSVWSHCVFVP